MIAETSRSRLIWYKLVNSSTGQPYKGTTSSTVSMLSSDFIAQFRDAVKAENPNKLSSFDSTDLLVYKNQAAFDNRNAEDEAKEEPLEEDSLIGDLGKSKKEALIVVIPAISSNERNNEPSAKRRRVMEKEGLYFVKDLHLKLPAPSSFADFRHNKSWVHFQANNPNKIITHRHRSEEPSIPVCLLNPIFNDFTHDLNQINISSQDCDFVADLTESMCGTFVDKQQRTNCFIHLFEQYTALRLTPILGSKYTTDGSLIHGSGALYCNLEVKVESGSGHSDPYIQSIAYYIYNLPEVPNNIQYPCFLLVLFGTAFTVYGILNSDSQIICDPLSPTYQLFHNQEFVVLQQIMKLFASLRKHLSILQKQENKVQVPSSFPFLSSFYDRNTNEEFIIQYQQIINRLLFSAKRLNSDKEVMVKFCSRYNRDVHLYCHSCGFAPTLISYSTHGNYIAVVMEKLKLKSLTEDHLSKPEIRQQIENISSRLKEMNYVHGDLRDCNIGFDTDNNQVIVLDFDWAGCHGVDLYPPFMNPVIEWPDGASTGKPLYHEHDVYWLDRLLLKKR